MASRRTTTRGRAAPGRGLSLATVVAVAVLWLAWPTPAGAHTELLSCTPSTGAPVSVATERVLLVFADDVVPGSADVVVRDPDGRRVTEGPASTRGSVVDVVVVLAAPGRHTIDFRVVGADGHVIAGSSWFSVVVGGAPAPDPGAVPGDGPESAGAFAGSLDVGASGGDGASSGASYPGWVLWLAPGSVALAWVVVGTRHRRSPEP